MVNLHWAFVCVSNISNRLDNYNSTMQIHYVLEANNLNPAINYLIFFFFLYAGLERPRHPTSWPVAGLHLRCTKVAFVPAPCGARVRVLDPCFKTDRVGGRHGYGPCGLAFSSCDGRNLPPNGTTCAGCTGDSQSPNWDPVCKARTLNATLSHQAPGFLF